MSVIGKGRGRGFTDLRDAPLRRPGQSSISKFNDLINLINNSFVQDAISEEKIDEIVQMIGNSLKNNSLKEVFEDLHKQALEDRQFGIKLAITCSNPKIYSLNDCNLRLILLQTLQKDYEEREEIKKKSFIQFRNAISLLGGVYSSLKLNGKPMDILAIPLLQYLELLLDTSEEEDIELLTSQVLINGRQINEQSSTGFEDFLMCVRQVLVNRNISAKSRAMLLFVIDLSNQHFTPLLGKLQAFYVIEFDSSAFLLYNVNNARLLHHFSEEDDVCNKFSNMPGQSSVDNPDNSMIKAARQQNSSGYEVNERSPPDTNSEKLSVPRAIRGAGAGGSSKDKNIKKSPRGKKDKVTDEQIWSLKQNTSSKVWGHDDRFDKDYAQT